MKLKVGMEAPDFCLQDQEFKTHRLSTYRGRWVVLFFYPKDSSFFCTREACSFRDESNFFQSHDVAVLGISTDSAESHKAFAENQKLNYPLLADFTKSTSQDYGVLLPLGIANRVTFIVGPDGKVAEIFRWVNWFNYGQKISERLKELGATKPAATSLQT